MTEASDSELLERFAGETSEEAFAQIVERHVGLVHSVALRQTSNPEQAQDITQAVFIVLARKARSLGPKVVLAGWLYNTARLTAGNFQRSEMRRIRREQEAFMESNTEEHLPDAAWSELSPFLEDAMGRLRASDRDALVLRFFENKSLQEVGVALGVEERTAQKRVRRALEKLRKIFGKRGVASTTAIIAGSISANSVQAAPVGLSGTITATAVHGTAVGSSTLSLVKGVLKFMAWSKAKMAIGCAVAVLLVGGVATVAVTQSRPSPSEDATKVVNDAVHAYTALSSYSDSGTVVVDAAGQQLESTFEIRMQRPNLYRVSWTSQRFMSDGEVSNDGTGDYLRVGKVNQQGATAKKMDSMGSAFGAASGVSSQVTMMVPTFFFNEELGREVPAGSAKGRFFPGFVGRQPFAKEHDESIGGVDCFVISSSVDESQNPKGGRATIATFGLKKMKTTIWIGKKDHFIRRVRTAVTTKGIDVKKFTDAELTRILTKQKKTATPEEIAKLRARMETAMKNAGTAATQGGEFIYTQTHDNIQVNQKFGAADFK